MLFLTSAALLALHASQAIAAEACPNTIKYTTVKGYFLQDDPETDPSTFDYTANNFGLIDRNYPGLPPLKKLTQWQKFERKVDKLNANAKSNVQYKVLFMGRHGEGYHNAAESYYGTPAWNCYWSLLNGNGTVTWFDPDLTEQGIKQAQIAHDFWAHELSVEKTPAPQSYYTSPLTRCTKTANMTFNGLDLPHPFVPTIKELMREGISLHTCDHRRNKRFIHNLFPTWNFEPGFSQKDNLWNGVSAETSASQDIRSKKWLDQIFSEDDSTWISVTSHSGEIRSTLRVLGHQEFILNTGAVIPVLVKAETLPQDDTTTAAPTFSTSAHCAATPITSNDQGCSCTDTPITTPLVKVTNTNSAGPTAYPGKDC